MKILTQAIKLLELLVQLADAANGFINYFNSYLLF